MGWTYVWAIVAAIGLVACTEDPIRLPIEDPSHGGGLAWGDETGLEPDGSLLLDFGAIHLDKISARALTLQNLSDEAISVELSEVAPPFSAFLEALEIPPRSEIRVSFSFSPLAAGEFAADLEIRGVGGGGGTTLPVSLRGSALPRQEPEGCRWEVEPSELLFTVGPDEPGIRAEGRVWVRALGKASCKVGAIRLEGSDAFSVRGVDGDLVLSGGSRWPIPISFHPVPDASAALRFEVDGEEVRIPLGTTETPRCARLIEHHPPPLLGIGCSPEPWAQIRNLCDHELRRSSVDITPAGPLNAHLGIDTIPYWGSTTLDVSYSHLPLGNERALAVVSFDNGDRLYLPIEPELSFRMEEKLLGGNPSYLLFVIDNSEAMAPYQEFLSSLAEEVAAVVRWSWSLDLHIAITTTSLRGIDGCGGENGALVPIDGSRPRVVTPDTPNLEEVLAENFSVESCAPKGQGAGLEAAYQALGIGGPPPWWNESRAPVQLVLISAEEDHSPSHVSLYLSAFEWPALRWPVVITGTEECDGLARGYRYESFAEGLHGTVSPLCDPETLPLFVSELQNAFISSTLGFNWEPDHWPADLNGDGALDEGDGIQLLVDGILVPMSSPTGVRNWRLNSDNRSISFSSGFPFVSRTRLELRVPHACPAAGKDENP